MATKEHCYYCFDVLSHKLASTPSAVPGFAAAEQFPLFVTWNILKGDSHRLRGCIGNFEPQPIGKGLHDYALISALKDSRFSPVTAKELPKLECGVSLLTNFELCSSYLDWTVGVHGIYIHFLNPSLFPPPISSATGSDACTPDPESSPAEGDEDRNSAAKKVFNSLAKLPAFKIPDHPNPRRLPKTLSATYLPDVMPAQGWTKVEALDSAIRKAGYSGKITEDIRRTLRVTRYQSSKIEASYEEWQQARGRA